jgi:hypothetical protein
VQRSDVLDADVRQVRWTMELTGTVTNGVVVLDNAAKVPEGTRVRVTVPADSDAVETATAASPLGERLMKLAGTANELPSDMAAQHDHYLHGQPKR